MVRSVATVVHGDFEWDDDKAATNLVKHRVAFTEAALVTSVFVVDPGVATTLIARSARSS